MHQTLVRKRSDPQKIARKLDFSEPRPLQRTQFHAVDFTPLNSENCPHGCVHILSSLVRFILSLLREVIVYHMQSCSRPLQTHHRTIKNKGIKKKIPKHPRSNVRDKALDRPETCWTGALRKGLPFHGSRSSREIKLQNASCQMGGRKVTGR